jgi:hypothetical protein
MRLSCANPHGMVNLLPPQQRQPRTTETVRASEPEEELEDEEEEEDGALQWKNSKAVATRFFQWLCRGNFDTASKSAGAQHDGNSSSIDLNSVDREMVHILFESFFAATFSSANAGDMMIAMNNREKRQRRRLEAVVLAILKRQRLYKSKRYNDDTVICSFARSDKTFAPFADRKTARDKLREQRETLTADKGGVVVAHDFSMTLTHDTNRDAGNNSSGGRVTVLPVNQAAVVTFSITLPSNENRMSLAKVRIGGSHQNAFQIKTKLPFKKPNSLELSFTGARVTGVYRATLWLTFQNSSTKEQFVIVRSVLLRAGGDADLYDMIQATSPYVKKKKYFEKPTKKNDIIHPPPADDNSSGGGGSGYKKLKMFKVPLDVREMVESREIECDALVTPTSDISDQELVKVYPAFWQNLVWISELQAYEDIKLFDMQDAALQRSGRFFKLYVAGLAEGRPSILRGDLIICKWKGKEYRGRVFAVELLDVLLEFHQSFHKKFDPSVDRVDLVRFTFTRTSFRTSHAGCLAAPNTMGPRMLAPQARHVQRIESQRQNGQVSQRVLPKNLSWGCQTLNEEQKKAVTEIAKGMLRPMPYCIFGPPGTGYVHICCRLHV